MNRIIDWAKKNLYLNQSTLDISTFYSLYLNYVVHTINKYLGVAVDYPEINKNLVRF